MMTAACLIPLDSPSLEVFTPAKPPSPSHAIPVIIDADRGAGVSMTAMKEMLSNSQDFY